MVQRNENMRSKVKDNNQWSSSADMMADMNCPCIDRFPREH